MKLSANQAAKAVGKSVPTITRAIKNGKLSATILDGGGYEIDPAELHRVWPPVTVKDDTQPQMLGSVTPSETLLEVERLRAELAGSRALSDSLADQVADLRRRLDVEGEERRQLMARLTDQREATPAAPVGLWGRMLGKRAG